MSNPYFQIFLVQYLFLSQSDFSWNSCNFTTFFQFEAENEELSKMRKKCMNQMHNLSTKEQRQKELNAQVVSLERQIEEIQRNIYQ